MFTGQIAMWSGTLGNIPAGWQLCDGTNGTPDLENTFVIGSQGSLAIGDTGGNAVHLHTFTEDGHFHRNAGLDDLRSGAARNEDTAISYDTATTDNKKNLPPWYALAFIMRMI